MYMHMYLGRHNVNTVTMFDRLQQERGGRAWMAIWQVLFMVA